MLVQEDPSRWCVKFSLSFIISLIHQHQHLIVQSQVPVHLCECSLICTAPMWPLMCLISRQKTTLTPSCSRMAVGYGGCDYVWSAGTLGHFLLVCKIASLHSHKKALGGNYIEQWVKHQNRLHELELQLQDLSEYNTPVASHLDRSGAVFKNFGKI